MSAIAGILLEDGTSVSGSDLRRTPITRRLEALGAKVYEGHDAAHVGDAGTVVISSAVPVDNPEFVEAKERGIPVLKRAQVLGQLMEGRLGVAVAGTHGKTTTSAMIAFILEWSGLDPTALVGGELVDWGTNARVGKGSCLVAEADEFDGSFLHLEPQVAVVTNVELDHPDHYPSLQSVVRAFRQFLASLPPNGCAIICGDDPQARQLAGPGETLIYGLGPDAGWQATNLSLLDGGGHSFDFLSGGTPLATFRLRIPGVHNVMNALGAICAAHRLGVPVQTIREALEEFRGVRRRFELIGATGDVTVVDDYAHHPTEIAATLATAREAFPRRRIWAIFQPHTYSRTKALLGDFSRALGAADHVVVTGIYASRETDDLGLSGEEIVNLMDHDDATFIADLGEVTGFLASRLTGGELVLTLGAGDVWRVAQETLDALSQRGAGTTPSLREAS
jgi:UDP-N-acetylmuramate--alanine ligase